MRGWGENTVELNAYRYGFNGKEKDTDGEWGELTHYDYGFRIYNPSIGKFLSVDPLMKSYPMLTPYQFASNSPIANIDLDGLEKKLAIIFTDIDGKHDFVTNEDALKADGFEIHHVKTGSDVLDVLSENTELNKEPIEHLVFLSHGFEGGLIGQTGNNTGLYDFDHLLSDASDIEMDRIAFEENEHYSLENIQSQIDGWIEAGAATVGDVSTLIENKKVIFNKNAKIVIGGCNSGMSCDAMNFANGNSDYDTPDANFALELSKVFSGSVIFSSQVVINGWLALGGTRPYPNSGTTPYRQGSRGGWTEARDGNTKRVGSPSTSVINLSTGKPKKDE